ncbi:sigma 54-interacting transcriptional regulator [Oceanobacillus timonensis]|uniref:sigma 54-interacting transcriptional regulator n=1 Tax=Oceanobacillus timonensis TaxID=1926285 RepID=UPI0015C41EBD|nr:sigma 54-interacting transcriptional regulator [Oceanobacillus timonensis]
MSRITDIYQYLSQLKGEAVTAVEVGEQLNIDRSTASRYLNDLVKRNKANKISGKPVRYALETSESSESEQMDLIGSEEALRPILETGMAAFSYPSRPLPILFTGETGTGKSYLAEKLSQLAVEQASMLDNNAFVSFNCADYAQNPELLIGQIFGIKKGAFTGADEDKRGLVDMAHKGILFLDEIHRLPPSGQEMLFYLMDKGTYHRLGDATHERTAEVAIIGATTENPDDVLLPTLLRRFSIKLNIPPLRERTYKEREKLIDSFLQEEAAKMSTTLSIEADCREAFLTYDCPGNIGQLKSDIQIACAHAYYRYLNSDRKHVVIKLEDFLGYSENNTENKKKKVPLDIEHDTGKDSANVPNIYQYFDSTSKNSKKSTQVLEKVVIDYISELNQKYRHLQNQRESWNQLIDKDLFDTLHYAGEALKETFGFPIPKRQLFVLGLHLQNFRNHLRNDIKKTPIPVVVHPNASYRQAANQIAYYLKEQIGMTLPAEEIELMTHFITPENDTVETVMNDQKIAVLLVMHGKSTASSMSEVVNYLLGNRVIHAIDMPLHITAEETYEQVKTHIQQFKTTLENIEGVLLLVDIGSLITMGDTIKNDVDVPLKTISSVNLSMVMEAGRQSLVSEQTLSGIYEDTKAAMLKFVKEEEETKHVQKKRLIATVCFTGEGAAQLLEDWIKKQISQSDQDVLIRSVRVDPSTNDTSVLHELQNYYEVIAIIGTVPVTIDGVPYIPAWELLQEEGVSRMHRLLEITRKSMVASMESNAVEREEIYHLIIDGLQEITTYGNPKSIANILQNSIPPVRDYYQWDSGRELGMWMHIGGLVDRLIASRVQSNPDKLMFSFPLDDQEIIPTEKEKSIWEIFHRKLEQELHLTVPEHIKKELVKLSR